MNFNSICQKLIDGWLNCQLDMHAEPARVYSAVLRDLNVRMRLAVIDIRPQLPKDWVLIPVRQTNVMSRIIDLNSLFGGGKLGDIKDQNYISTSVLPAYNKAIDVRQPLIDIVETKLLGVKVIYDRIILPERTKHPEWLITFTNGRFMAGAPTNNIEIDSTDEAILAALIEGMSAKEIAFETGLSHRTVEHRLERAKKQMGAKSLHHLAAMFVTAGFDGSIRRSNDIPS
jgi:DNA-binding CsgD family transcriptional regulator